MNEITSKYETCTDLPDLLFGLTECKGLRLSEEVAEKDAVVLRTIDGVVRSGWGQEVRRDELSTLVNQLVERVLAVGSSSSPDDRLQKTNSRSGYLYESQKAQHTPVW